MKFASIRAAGEALYGAVTEAGFIALTPNFPQWATLTEVIRAQALPQLAQAAEGASVTHDSGRFTYDMPVAGGEKIICVGVNFPDRNAEYKDGSQAPCEYVTLSTVCPWFRRT